MKSSEFKHYKPKFEEYNQVQSLVVPHLDSDCNLVISLATATGKTVLAEGAFSYHLSSDYLCRVAYISPFKSIGEEKVGEWSLEPQLCKYGIGVMSSDRSDEREAAMSSRLVVSTLESFDSATRSKSNEDWLKTFSIIVFDEAHIIGSPVRGAVMEALMMRISCINPKCRFMLLSGTMGNAREIAVWLKSLNGKPTKVIKSSWRPFPVKIVYHEVASYRYKVSKAVSIIEEIVSEGSKVIVFVHAKETGKEICKILLKKKISCAFHNSSCSVKNRKLIEDSFSASKFKVLISTSTLGAGVNLHD